MFGVMKRRILFVNRFFEPDQSATSQMLTSLAVTLAERGHKIGVLTSSLQRIPTKKTLPKYSEVLGVAVYRVSVPNLDGGSLFSRGLSYLAFLAGARFALKRVAREFDIVIVKTDPPILSGVLQPLIKKLGLIGVNWHQDVYPEIAIESEMVDSNSIFARGLHLQRNRALNLAHLNVVISASMQDYLQVCAPAANFSVAENWSPHNIEPTPLRANPLRDEFGLTEKFVVGYSGNLGRVHEFSSLLETMRRFNGNDSLSFVVSGGGAGRALLDEAIARDGLSNVLCLPYFSDEQLSDGLGLADVHIVIHPSSYEAYVLPSKIYGIFAAGRPVIVVGSLSGSLAQMVTEAGCGVVVDSDDPSALVAAIRHFQVNPELGGGMGKAAREIHVKRYDIMHAIRRWDSLIGGL